MWIIFFGYRTRKTIWGGVRREACEMLLLWNEDEEGALAGR